MISAVTQPTAANQTNPAASSPTDAGTATALSSDFETFLKMLTAQARFQDPLEPLDSSQYAAQLAQFSMVEQQVLSNDLLNALSGQLGAGNMSQMAGWIGMEARTTAPVAFDGAAVTLYPNPVSAADEVALVTYDANGVEVQRRAIPVSADPVAWYGVTDGGTSFAQGSYRFEIESYANGELLATDPAESYARVTEARLQDNETVLILQGGMPVLAGSVTALREPS